MRATPYTVSELVQSIKMRLDQDPALQDIWLEGEVSNFTRSSAGHLYFTLKDPRATISCVMWRSAVERSGYIPQHGDAVLAHGSISLYEVRGQLQFYTDLLQPAGAGDLHRRYEQLKATLLAEGLFDAERKRALPPYPRRVGVVTSPQAAAWRDVLNVLRRRYPLVEVLLSPTLVQGDLAPPQIVAALAALNQRDDLDLVLLVRGGGSLEELWAFNDERVVRAVAASRHPIICGVGHEVDLTLADLAADQRAPTPSAAAELAVPDRQDVAQQLHVWAERLRRRIEQQVDQERQQLGHQARLLDQFSPQTQIATSRQQVDDMARRGAQALAHALALRSSKYAGLRARLDALSPLSTLARGYAVVRQSDTGAVVRRVDQVHPGDLLRVRVHDGEFGAEARGP
jgi:exodeoxyribonuclease VII large subunit